MADGQEVVVRGGVQRVGLVQLLHRLLGALPDGGQLEAPLGQQSGARTHGWEGHSREEVMMEVVGDKRLG